MFVAWSGLLSWVQTTDVGRSLHIGSFCPAMTSLSRFSEEAAFNISSSSQETEETSRTVENVILTTKGLQERNTQMLDGTTGKNRQNNKLILTKIGWA